MIPVKQPEKDFFNVTGLKLKNGKMNMSSGFLEEENLREFEVSLPMFALTVIRKKNINYKIVKIKKRKNEKFAFFLTF